MGMIGQPNNYEKRIKDMRVGEKGYIHPSSIQFDLAGRPHLNVLDTFFKKKESGRKIPIERIGSGIDEYNIDIRRTSYAFDVVSKPFEHNDEGSNKFEKYEAVVMKYSLQRPKRLSLQERIERDIKSAVKTEDFEKAAQLKNRLLGIGKK